MSDIARLQALLDQSRCTVAVTGAGISVPAGISAFEGMDLPTVMQMSSTAVLRAAPEHYYKMARKAFLQGMFENGPTVAHKKLAELEAAGRLHGVVTTNLDHLHAMAGSCHVAEIQGSFAQNTCLTCGRQVNDVRVWNQGHAPRCSCGGLLCAYPVHAHIGLLERELARARQWLAQAELVLFIGTNGPYASAYFGSIRRGATIAQINPNPTQFDEAADLNIRRTADEALARIR